MSFITSIIGKKVIDLIEESLVEAEPAIQHAIWSHLQITVDQLKQAIESKVETIVKKDLSVSPSVSPDDSIPPSV